MEFTPTTNEGSDVLDNLKKNILDDNLHSSADHTSSEDAVASLNALDEDLSEQSATFSMSEISAGGDLSHETPEQLSEQSPQGIDLTSDENSSGISLTVPSSDSISSPEETLTGGPSAAPSDDFSEAKLSSIQIEEEAPSTTTPVFSFDDEDDHVEKKTFMGSLSKILRIRIRGHSLTLFVLSGIVFFVALLGAAYFYYAERYVYYSTRPRDSLDETSLSILEKIEGYRVLLQGMGILGDDAQSFVGIDADTDGESLNNILMNKDLSYVEKYDTFGSYMQLLHQRIPHVHGDLVKLREELASYPFFPDTLQELVDPSDDASLQRSLLSLEAVKFRTAIAVFSKFDTFVRQFALDGGYEKDQIQEFIDTMMERGDRDIDYYLTTCYLNPYEHPDTCAQYGDFARMYDVYESDSEGIDTKLFARMMGFIEDKLERSVLPSLALSTRDFDPIAQQLTLVIDINTLPDDTLQLLKQGILNPHVYVVGHMINFLRQSKFIISETINVNSLEIEKVTLPVGSKEVTVSTSHFEFTLPLQKNTQREITDYFVRTKGTVVELDDESDALLSGDVLSGANNEDFGSGDAMVGFDENANADIQGNDDVVDDMDVFAEGEGENDLESDSANDLANEDEDLAPDGGDSFVPENEVE